MSLKPTSLISIVNNEAPRAPKATLVSGSSLNSLTPENLPRIAKIEWPRSSAQLKRFRKMEFPLPSRVVCQVTCPGEGFVCDPACSSIVLPESSFDVREILRMVLSCILTETLSTRAMPHTTIEEVLHKKGVVLMNWPYGARGFFEKTPLTLSMHEQRTLLEACLHPNPASRIQIVSRHHFPSDAQPGYFSYVSSFHEDPRQRELVDEEHHKSFEIPPEPFIIHYQDDQCPCHLSTCRPIDFSAFLDTEADGPVGKDSGSDATKPTIKRARSNPGSLDQIRSVKQKTESSADISSSQPQTGRAGASAPHISPKVARSTASTSLTASHSSVSAPGNKSTAQNSSSTSQKAGSTSSLTSLSDSVLSGSTQEITDVMQNLKVFSTLSFDANDKRELIHKTLNKLTCIPSTPLFPPLTENAWSAIVELAKLHQIDDCWLRDRISGWISHLLKISSVSLDDLPVAIRAVRKLLRAMDTPFRKKYTADVEARMKVWWENVVDSETTEEVYVRALEQLIDFGACKEIKLEDMAAVKDHWTDVYYPASSSDCDDDQLEESD
ncbi:hypothetical protein SISSUDRAFT_1123670 [Sistotremastrum suecicum HHB10207 ss-3]|uniref:Uncharacterized protein n=1 Tax=Sistotremastrum suecicum HHB10207 ss-3 TaxID=1314776 RepID=A0A165X6C5_9AGAM|nr:hypothetical protein SISSUDRAFT_1123670 [Sistotremastrum suecicum HHB10207 ss-3]